MAKETQTNLTRSGLYDVTTIKSGLLPPSSSHCSEKKAIKLKWYRVILFNLDRHFIVLPAHCFRRSPERLYNLWLSFIFFLVENFFLGAERK